VHAGSAKRDVTPRGNMWLDGMIRSRASAGVHDAIFARALVLGNGQEHGDACALVSVDVCVLDAETTREMRAAAEARSGIPAQRIVIAATHTHSAPAAMGIFNPREEGFVRDLSAAVAECVAEAASRMRPALAGSASGAEETISHYRRLMARDGHVVMNWEPFAPEDIVGPLGEADAEVGVVKVVDAAAPHAVIALLFNHAGHPNILSGDNYSISGDYPGMAAGVLEERFGGTALFFNGAEGSVDIDGLRHRDWDGRERAGRALAASVAAAAESATVRDTRLRCGSVGYELPGRRITEAEWAWAGTVLARTGGAVAAVADGVGDDYKAVHFQRLHDRGPAGMPVEQVCIALGDCALITFPGELYTEIGKRVKAASPFARTCILGLANGYVGYVPTGKAIQEGGYAEDTRWVDAAAEETVLSQSLALLTRIATEEKEGE
jgi:neutral ceramidase